jgi:S1-C subfamily serine protease
LPVAATTQQPNRAGILIVGVSSGSVADKSGLIIGDILYQMDGHPLKTLAELQKAVAGCVANSLVPVKLYRGLMDTQIAARF